jgi:type III secretion system low calcium response chaperone LcrH/SycD
MNAEEISELLKKLMGNVESEEAANILQLSQESLSTLYSLAYYLYENGKFVDAKSVFRFLTLSDAFDRRYWMGLAASYQMLKDYPAALECYSLAAVQNPDDPYVHLHAADCFFAGGESLKAVKTLESAIAAAKKKKDEELCSQLLLMHASWIAQPSR